MERMSQLVGCAFGNQQEPIREDYPKNCDTCLNPDKGGRKDGIWRIPRHLGMDGEIHDAEWATCDKRATCEKISEFRNRYIRTNKRRSEMPPKLAEKKLSDFKATEKWQAQLKKLAEYWVSDRSGKWLSICGQSGSGKTLLCSGAVNERLEKGCRVFYKRWADIMQPLKHFDRKLYEVCKDFPILFIDDLYKGTPTDMEIKATAELIDYRYTHNLTTVITSERSSRELSEIDQATFSRIVEMCDECFFSIPEKTSLNYRLRKIFKKND